MWNRIVGLRRLGIEIQLMYWLLKREDVTVESRVMMESQVSDLIQVHRRHSVLDLIDLKYPARMLSFDLRGEAYRKISDRARAFNPDAIMLEGWPGYLVARRLATDLKKVLIYRSQNVEHTYYRSLAKAASGISKLKLLMTAAKMRRAESEIRSLSDIVLDISEDDARDWGITQQSGKWMVLPTTWDFTEIPRIGSADIDVCYIGNLWTPNNVEGITWFCEKVMPLIDPGIASRLKIVFAGSNPTRKVLEMCERNGIRCDANPMDMQPYLANSRIFINPVLSGSGINIKMIEMLQVCRPIVATLQAVRGLPNELKKFVTVAADERSFAAAVESELKNTKEIHNGRREIITRHFGQSKLRDIVDLLDKYSRNPMNTLLHN
jgi:hypothetical protein